MNIQFNTKFKILPGVFWVEMPIGNIENNKFCKDFSTIAGIYDVSTYLNEITSLFDIQISQYPLKPYV
jgi:hypothetical protein